jgi:mannose-6-phosphate isomerase-like protein (cupin superfamily)
VPAIRQETLSEKRDWLKASAFGLFRVPKGNPASFDLHYHDADEIWFSIEGRARIMTEGTE